MHLLLVCVLALSPVASPQQTPAPTRAKAQAPLRALDINAASAEDFQKLPGIGPKLAQRLVAFRRKHGPFRRVEDLMAVKGIGLKKWKALRPYLRVGGNSQKAKEQPGR